MAQSKRIISEVSLRRVLGFAFNQGFVFFLFYMGGNVSYDIGGFLFERADLFGMLFFMVVGLAIIKDISERQRAFLLSRPFLIVYALCMVVGSPLFLGGVGFPEGLLAESVLVGVPAACLLAAWGRSFGRVDTDHSVPEVFLGSLAAAFLCLFISLFPDNALQNVLCVLPLASVALLDVPEASAKAPSAPSLGHNENTANMLSLKIITGTLMFGTAAGLMKAYATAPGSPSMTQYPLSMLFFCAFLLGALSLLLSDGFGKGAALNKSYRLAIFVMLFGILLVFAPGASSWLPGEAVSLAGYLGLEAVLISLFLVLARINGIDTARSFTHGFIALFGGEAIGLVCANLFDAAGADLSFEIAVMAGALVLFSYVFLFTEQDFGDLSEIVTSVDSFDQVCEAMCKRFKLSKREAEILPLALKGRTSERIAQGLSISKSTADTHLRRIYMKAGVHSRQELIDLSEGETR